MMVGGYAVLKRRINLVMLESSKGGGIVIGALNLLCSKVLELRLEVPHTWDSGYFCPPLSVLLLN